LKNKMHQIINVGIAIYVVMAYERIVPTSINPDHVKY